MTRFPRKCNYDCPICGSCPELCIAHWGAVYYVSCSKCRWEGKTRAVCFSDINAIEYWNDKVVNHLSN